MKNKLYIVTGSSKGLGRALVNLLLQNENNKVIGLSRNGYKEVHENYTDLLIDLSDSTGLAFQLGKIFPEGDFSEITLINNAGWLGNIGPLGKLDPKGIADIQAINVVAPAMLMNGFIKQYAQLKAIKRIINISSGAANKNLDGWSGYSSSKAALNRITEVAQEESNLHGYDIKYFSLSPGIIETGMQEYIRSSKQEDFSNVEVFKNYQTNQLLSSPSEVADKILYLIENQDKFQGVIQDVRKF